MEIIYCFYSRFLYWCIQTTQGEEECVLFIAFSRLKLVLFFTFLAGVLWDGEMVSEVVMIHISPHPATTTAVPRKPHRQGTKSAGQEFWTINLFITSHQSPVTTQVVSFQNANCFTAAFVFVSSFVQIPWDWDVLSGLRGDHSGP